MREFPIINYTDDVTLLQLSLDLMNMFDSNLANSWNYSKEFLTRIYTNEILDYTFEEIGDRKIAILRCSKFLGTQIVFIRIRFNQCYQLKVNLTCSFKFQCEFKKVSLKLEKHVLICHSSMHLKTKDFENSKNLFAFSSQINA